MDLLPPLERGGKELREDGTFGAAAALRMATAMMTKIPNDNGRSLNFIVIMLYCLLRLVLYAGDSTICH